MHIAKPRLVLSALFCYLWIGQSLSATDCRWEDYLASSPETAKEGEALELRFVAHFSEDQLNARLGSLVGPAEHAVDAYYLSFRSSYAEQTKLDLSAMVYVPTSCASNYPTIVLQHGTIINNADAPTNRPGEGLAEAAKGFISLVPDYLGYGQSVASLHPYLIADSYAKGGVDAMYALRQITDAEGVTAFADLFLKGYSEGGYATLALQRTLEADYQDQFPIRASAPAAGPYNMLLTSYDLISRPQTNATLTSFVSVAYFNYLPQDRSLAEVLPAAATINLPYLYSGAFSYEQVAGLLPSDVNQLLDVEYRQSFLSSIADYLNQDIPLQDTFTQSLLDNSLDQGWQIQSLTRLYHCVDDDLVSIQSSDNLFDRLGKNNPAVSYERIKSIDGQPPYSHGNCPAIFKPLFWFKELLTRQSKM